jgi:hypothetical protein
MRYVKQTAAFKKYLKREMAGRYRAIILEELPTVSPQEVLKILQEAGKALQAV